MDHHSSAGLWHLGVNFRITPWGVIHALAVAASSTTTALRATKNVLKFRKNPLNELFVSHGEN